MFGLAVLVNSPRDLRRFDSELTVRINEMGLRIHYASDGPMGYMNFTKTNSNNKNNNDIKLVLTGDSLTSTTDIS